MREAKEPFQFVTASYLIRIRPEQSRTLGDMAAHLRSCSENSILYHTYQSLETHHYSVFSSDFAQWVMAACNEHELAERLAAVDLRDFVSLEDVRAALIERVEGHLQEHPESAERKAFEAFHFCEATEVTVPLPAQARNLAELVEGIRHMSLHTLHYHFINARLRLRLQTTDFSYWLDTSLAWPELAARVNSIEFAPLTLEQVREKLIEILEPFQDQ